MQDQASIKREHARRVLRLRLDGTVFQPFRAWKSVTSEMDMKSSEITEIRKSEEFADEVSKAALGKATVFYNLGQRVSYKVLRDWLKAAFGLEFARANAKEIWHQVQKYEPTRKFGE